MVKILDKDEEKYAELTELSQELHIPVAQASWRLEAFDKDGKLLQAHRQRSHSWVRNMYNVIACQFLCVNPSGAYGPGAIRVRRVDYGDLNETRGIWLGYASSIETGSSSSGIWAGLGEDNKGIVIGTSAAAWDVNHYTLQGLIADGNGAGQMNYAETLTPSKSYVGLTYSAEWVRYMNNNSGGLIGINEVGIYYFVFQYTGGTASHRVMTCRDVLGATVNIPNTGQVKVTYTIQLTFPA